MRTNLMKRAGPRSRRGGGMSAESRIVQGLGPLTAGRACSVASSSPRNPKGAHGSGGALSLLKLTSEQNCCGRGSVDLSACSPYDSRSRWNIVDIPTGKKVENPAVKIVRSFTQPVHELVRLQLLHLPISDKDFTFNDKKKNE
ncbi:Hypothetical protein NTJ_04890 [Nesidiocoris tenuis]|uniref:Uncharacterized protein n=1 Tax=Nesidiocoris tenuis TaxID=355587 RepID=A0ABN7AIK0_9HEMI|nr:Hypothetical protein NTJ_04890 [Nesidiocoris tenuis]